MLERSVTTSKVLPVASAQLFNVNMCFGSELQPVGLLFFSSPHVLILFVHVCVQAYLRMSLSLCGMVMSPCLTFVSNQLR